MTTKPTYEELEQKVKELEYIAIERKQTEEALHESEELFRNVYDTAPLAFVLWDLNTCVTDWNKKAEEVFGWSKEEALGHNFFDFLIPDKDRPQVRDVVDRLLKGELPSHSINDNLTKDGQIITCEWNNSPLHDDDGNIVGAISLALDITDRKRNEEALRQREATLESIFRAAPTGIGMVSNRVLKRVNDRICEMTGYSREELLDQSARMLYPTDEDFEYVGTEKYAQIRERGIGTIETRWRRKDGKVIDVLLSSTPVDPDDLKAGVTFTALDITERKLAEEELRESEDRYRRITEAITDYIYTVTVQDGRPGETIHGPACVAVTGYTTDDFKANPYLWIQMVHEEDRKAVEEQAACTLSGVKVPALEHRIIRKDGATRWVRNTPVMNFDSQGKLLAYDGLVQDITERKRAEEALRRSHDELELRVKERTAELVKANDELKREIKERKQVEQELRQSEEKYRTVLETNPDPVVVYDMDGKVTYFNLAFTTVFGWTLEERLGKKMDVFVPEENWPETKMMLNKILAGESFSGIETHRYTKEGNIIPVSISAAFYRDRNGKAVGSIVNLRNISEQKKAEEALRESEKRLHQDQKRLDMLRFANDVALKLMHDLRNPLVTIGGYSRRISSRDYPEDKVKEYGNIIFEQSMRLDNALNEALVHLKDAAEQV